MMGKGRENDGKGEEGYRRMGEKGREEKGDRRNRRDYIERTWNGPDGEGKEEGEGKGSAEIQPQTSIPGAATVCFPVSTLMESVFRI